MDFAELVRTVRAIPPTAYGPDSIGRLLRDARFDDPLLSQIPTPPNGYTRNLVYANNDFEIIVLRWGPGAVTPIHDHSTQQCWFTAVTGAFDTTNYRRVAGGTLRGFARIEVAQSIRGLRSGEPDYRNPDDDIHRVSVSASCAEATSVHIYAKPVTTCLIFDEAGSRCEMKRMAYDVVLGDVIHRAIA
ncbi:MAG: cysteine dioxygenase [Vulcanimicrobiaceae bacterium]